MIFIGGAYSTPTATACAQNVVILGSSAQGSTIGIKAADGTVAFAFKIPQSYATMVLSSPERVFSRGELLDRVQGYQYEGYDRTIDSHVKNLRKKIAARLPDNEIILTLYGVGYKFSSDI
jgi:hypothetical protein